LAEFEVAQASVGEGLQTALIRGMLAKNSRASFDGHFQNLPTVLP